MQRHQRRRPVLVRRGHDLMATSPRLPCESARRRRPRQEDPSAARARDSSADRSLGKALEDSLLGGPAGRPSAQRSGSGLAKPRRCLVHCAVMVRRSRRRASVPKRGQRRACSAARPWQALALALIGVALASLEGEALHGHADALPAREQAAAEDRQPAHVPEGHGLSEAAARCAWCASSPARTAAPAPTPVSTAPLGSPSTRLQVREPTVRAVEPGRQATAPRAPPALPA